MLDKSHEPPDLTVPVPDSGGVAWNDEKKAAAVRAFEALRAHGNAGVERNLEAAATIGALKASLPRGEFGRFCTDELHISTSYRGRMLRLHDVKDHVPEALAWAQTQKHRLAECQSVQNLIKVVRIWLNKDRSPESEWDANTQKGRRSKDIIAELQQAIRDADAVVRDRDKTISEREADAARQGAEIAELRRRLTGCEEDIATLRDTLPDEACEQALEALTSPHESAADHLAAIAKRYHWRVGDLRRDLENGTAVQLSEA
jgi:hypothetical protein